MYSTASDRVDWILGECQRVQLGPGLRTSLPGRKKKSPLQRGRVGDRPAVTSYRRSTSHVVDASEIGGAQSSVRRRKWFAATDRPLRDPLSRRKRGWQQPAATLRPITFFNRAGSIRDYLCWRRRWTFLTTERWTSIGGRPAGRPTQQRRGLSPAEVSRVVEHGGVQRSDKFGSNQKLNKAIISVLTVSSPTSSSFIFFFYLKIQKRNWKFWMKL